MVVEKNILQRKNTHETVTYIEAIIIMTFVRRVSIESIFIFFALQLMLNISTSGKESCFV